MEVNNISAIFRNKYAIIGGVGVFVIAAYLVYSSALSSMKTESFNININKVEDIERLVSYQVFSDFYYRMVRTDANSNISAEYTRIIPLVTEIGFEHDGSQFTASLTSRLNGHPVTLDPNDRNVLSPYIRSMERFAREYAKIVAIDDPAYLTQAIDRARPLLPRGGSIHSDDFTFGGYSLGDTTVSIPNLVINPLLLHELQGSIKQTSVCRRDWCPYILYIEFSENDSIALRLIDRAQHFTADEFENYVLASTPDTVLVKTVAFHENKQRPMLIAFETGRNGQHANRASVYMMDVNGYIYQLVYNAYNSTSFSIFFNDFLKIAYGIRFIDTVAFTNNYYTIESTIPSVLDEMLELVTRTRSNESRLEQHQLLKHFGIDSYFSTREGVAVQKLSHAYQTSSGILSDSFRLSLMEFEDTVGHFDNLAMSKLANTQLNDLRVLSAAFDLEYQNTRMLGRVPRASRAAQQLKSACDTVDCLYRHYRN